MKPKFKTVLAWEQAQLLMQPAYIRVIDNIRKQLEESPWKGTYQEVSAPYPGYHLCLSRQDLSVRVDIWELCFRICFVSYEPTQTHVFNQEATQEVQIDTRLIDETGEVDWQFLETKAQQIVNQVFADLPSG